MDSRYDTQANKPPPILVTVKGENPLSSHVADVELDLSKFHNGRWALQLDGAFARRDAPVVILAQGVACLAVTWWAQLSPRSYLRSVTGALFASPLRVGIGQAGIAATVRAGPTYRLPFPSVVVSDSLFQVEDVLRLADQWGSRFVEAGDPTSEHPSNRRGAFDAMHELLLGYLDILGGERRAAILHADVLDGPSEPTART